MLKLFILVLLLSSIDMTSKAKTTTTKSTKSPKSGKQWKCPSRKPCKCFICPMFVIKDCSTDSDCSGNKKCVR